ncbi:hypothetical protein KPH14_009736 [Odynerus spinipes]|uniref:PiggyBac transposable element-derived protein domain-containing protein n=1 Tax=Odynerus spinipes TaxID=1348599 RepID=A0AAD9VHY2_9HYME|nr:hypothetical protein KPH14_009736 [Odynerus spinipes]
MVSKEDNNGIVVLKWKDSRDVRILSTKHAPIMVPSTSNIPHIHAASTSQHSSEKLKPLAVLAYNKGKCGIDYSDQMVAYASTMRKGLKWYRKLGLTDKETKSASQRSQHNIAIRKNSSGQSIRRACKICYKNKRLHTDRSKARANVKKTTFCPDCPDQPQLYMDCFKTFH